MIGRICQDLLRGTYLHDLPVFHNGDTIPQLNRLVKIMRNKDDRFLHLLL